MSLPDRQVARRILLWQRLQCGVGRALVGAGCAWLTAAPLRILRGLLTVPASPARAATPADVRAFLLGRANAASDVGTVLPALRRPDMAASVLRACLVDIETASAPSLSRLPLLLTADGALGRLGERPVLVPACPRLAHHFRAAAAHVLEAALVRVVLGADVDLSAVGLTTLSWATLPACLPRLLPPALRTAGLVAAPPGVPPLPWFHDVLADAAAEPGALDAVLDGWALVPVCCGATRVPNGFVGRAALGDVVLLAEPWDALAAVLVRLGLPHVAEAPRGVDVALSSVTALVRARTPLQWDAVTAADRRMLLDLVERAVPAAGAAPLPGQLTDADMQAVARLPLFALADRPTEFEPLGAAPPRLLPAGVTLAGRFFGGGEQWPRLYARLGIVPLSVAEMYTAHILPALPAMPLPERIAQLQRLAALFGDLGSDTAAVIAAVRMSS